MRGLSVGKGGWGSENPPIRGRDGVSVDSMLGDRTRDLVERPRGLELIIPPSNDLSYSLNFPRLPF